MYSLLMSRIIEISRNRHKKEVPLTRMRVYLGAYIYIYKFI